jgi:ABC-type xylose transport system permease subunit
MVSDNSQAPVVVYRIDRDGHLVTGLAKRADYGTYVQTERTESFLVTLAGQTVKHGLRAHAILATPELG